MEPSSPVNGSTLDKPVLSNANKSSHFTSNEVTASKMTSDHHLEKVNKAFKKFLSFSSSSNQLSKRSQKPNLTLDLSGEIYTVTITPKGKICKKMDVDNRKEGPKIKTVDVSNEF